MPPKGKRKGAAAAKKPQGPPASNGKGKGDNGPQPNAKTAHLSVTGVLASHPASRDVHIHNLTITFHGVELLSDARIELNYGRRYGLIGANGCGEGRTGRPTLQYLLSRTGRLSRSLWVGHSPSHLILMY